MKKLPDELSPFGEDTVGLCSSALLPKEEWQYSENAESWEIRFSTREFSLLVSKSPVPVHNLSFAALSIFLLIFWTHFLSL